MPRQIPFEQRVGIFIDVQNMFYAAKHLYGSKLNFTKLLDYIAKGRPLCRAIAYIVRTPEIDQSNFLTMLRSNGYEVRIKDLKQRPDGTAKGDWDMGMALDAMAMSDRLDVIAIVSGDGDFVELVNFLKARGVRVEVYSFPYSTAEELRLSATEFIQMGPEVVLNPGQMQRPIGRGFPGEFEMSDEDMAEANSSHGDEEDDDDEDMEDDDSSSEAEYEDAPTTN